MLAGWRRAIGALVLLWAIGFSADVSNASSVEPANQLSPDANLEQSLRGVVAGLGPNRQTAETRLAVSLLAVPDLVRVRFSAMNTLQEFYSANLATICALARAAYRLPT